MLSNRVVSKSNHGFLNSGENRLAVVDKNLVSIDFCTYRPRDGSALNLANEIDIPKPDVFYNLHKIVEIAGWNQSDETYCLRRHLLQE